MLGWLARIAKAANKDSLAGPRMGTPYARPPQRTSERIPHGKPLDGGPRPYLTAPMNYYEELGVSPSASDEEIHSAYRELARLLHPDRHQDRAVRLAAERQMMRLNSIYSVLSDPSQRALYDAHLSSCDHRLIFPEVYRSVGRLRLWGWIGGLAAVAALLPVYYSSSHPRVRDESIPFQQVGQQAAHLASEAVRAEIFQGEPPTQVQFTRRGAVNPAEHAGEATRSDPSPVVTLASSPKAGADSAPSTPPRTEPLPRIEGGADPSPLPIPPESSPKRQFAGIWLYVPRESTEMPIAAYPPEHIELRLSEQDGQVYGRYLARYRITDSTISPEVSFEFRGASGNETFSWRGAGGAQGEIRLRPLGDGQLEASWWAHQTSQRLSLASGTAVLIRERTP